MISVKSIILGNILLHFELMYVPEIKKTKQNIIQMIQILNRFSMVFLQDQIKVAKLF